MAAARRSLSASPLLPLLLSLLLLFSSLPSLSCQTLRSVTGCPLLVSNFTAQCSPSTTITLHGAAFPSNRRAPTVYVASTACASSSYLNSTSLTCRLPALRGRVVGGVWLDVYVAFNGGASSNHLAAVWYGPYPPSSSSSAPPSPRLSSTSAPRPPSSTSSPLPPSVNSTAPVIVSIHGCVDVLNRTLNCTYASRLTIVGVRFGPQAVLQLDGRVVSTDIRALNATHIVTSLPAGQYEPYRLLQVAVFTAVQMSNAFAGVSFARLAPIITSLRTGSSAPVDGIVRVLPGGVITIRGDNFPTLGAVHAVLNGTQWCATQVLSLTEAICALPEQLVDGLPRDTLLSLQVRTAYADSAPYAGVVVLPTGPVIYSVSGCDDNGNRTEACLLYAEIPITVVGVRFSTSAPPVVRVGQGKSALCNVTSYGATRFVCLLPQQSFMVGRSSYYLLNVQWAGGEAVSFTGISFTDVLPTPTVLRVTGSSCQANGSLAVNCSPGARLTITGEHFAPYITPRVNVSDTACPLRPNSGTTRNVLVCTASAALPAEQVLGVQVALDGVVSRWYPAVAFRAAAPAPSSTGRGGGGTGGGGGGGVGVASMSVADELVVTGLAVTMGVVLLVSAVCGVGWWMGKREEGRRTTWGHSELMMGDRQGAGVHAPYVPLAAQFGDAGLGERGDAGVR